MAGNFHASTNFSLIYTNKLNFELKTLPHLISKNWGDMENEQLHKCKVIGLIFYDTQHRMLERFMWTA